MDLKGMWKVVGIERYDVGKKAFVMENREDFIANGGDEDRLKEFGMLIELDDKQIKVIFVPAEDVPQETIDAAVAAGQVELEDGKLIIERFGWEMRDGKPYYEPHMTADGEPAPWEEIAMEGECIIFGGHLLEKI